MSVFTPSADSIVGMRVGRSAGERSRWFPLLMLGWSVWIFVTPLYESQYFPHWLWPTLASYALFLVLYWRAYYRSQRLLLGYALAIAALACAVTPFNPGAQGYVIYSCAFLAFCGAPRVALAWMSGVLLAYGALWQWCGWPNIYLFSTVLVGFMVGLLNITMIRKWQTDSALRLSHEEVRRLAATAERERIGRDLHDLLGHTLSLVALKADLAARLMAPDPAGARREIDEVAQISREALAQVRRAVTGIRAAGLAAELASARLLLDIDGIGLDDALAPVALSPVQETALALVLREAVTNIQRHARARQVRVALVRSADAAVLRIDDDGRGGRIVAGNGLTGMRERLAALGGTLRVQGHRAGTTLEARLPLAVAAASGAGSIAADAAAAMLP
jgi:two-component system, NarL family, sensor histidine kinase DesK